MGKSVNKSADSADSQNRPFEACIIIIADEVACFSDFHPTGLTEILLHYIYSQRD